MDKVKAVFIDANIFLEIALDDQHSDACKKLLRDIQKGKILAFTSDFIVYSCLHYIQQKKNCQVSLQKWIWFFGSFDFLTILRPSIDILLDAVAQMKKYRLDLDDALVIACMRSCGSTELVSFDKHFDRVREIKKKSPVE